MRDVQGTTVCGIVSGIFRGAVVIFLILPLLVLVDMIGASDKVEKWLWDIGCDLMGVDDK